MRRGSANSTATRCTASRELLLILREARVALQAEVDLLARASSLETELLQRLQASAEELAGQAGLLVRTLDIQGEDAVLRNEAMQLFRFFGLMKDQFTSLREGGWGQRAEEAQCRAAPGD